MLKKQRSSMIWLRRVPSTRRNTAIVHIYKGIVLKLDQEQFLCPPARNVDCVNSVFVRMNTGFLRRAATLLARNTYKRRVELEVGRTIRPTPPAEPSAMKLAACLPSALAAGSASMRFMLMLPIVATSIWRQTACPAAARDVGRVEATTLPSH